ncbi:hypothetical protein PFICI_07180 [Pestalotiopsis fici W106-1]|uniref:LCCL domain-containing protein n=1 Tax=Pestalotiopsis fici (strain W106-1 / CGMCC3.15140) TaxID=1229662 RepID=W3X7S6_PESFW|nr:uncharacterized protein PFICI_07180 [Pestalotiopsis fici W106-1]ETS82178.1 hypothetical protein PFICI_07180 [Pestalotiopsis fici W106-1]
MRFNDLFGHVMEPQEKKEGKDTLEGSNWTATTKNYQRDTKGPSGSELSGRPSAHHPDFPSQWRNGFDPILPSLQSTPLRWLERKFPRKRQKVLLFLGLSLGWYLAFAILSDTSIAPVKVDNMYLPVKQLQCTDSFWMPNYGCGLNGENCPVPPEEPVAFHCPANCAAIKVQEKPHLVGPLSIVDQPLVIGGPIYRADSWICASAVHADLLDGSRGGCGLLTRLGQTNSYTASKFNGISSIGVRTYFPQSYRFKIESGFDCHVSDQRWLLPYVSIAFTAVVFLFSSSPLLSFWTAVGIGFVQVRSLSTTSVEVGGLSVIDEVSYMQNLVVAARYIPAILCLAMVYTRSVKRALDKLSAQLEKTAFWLGACWLGLFQGYTLFDSRLTIPCLAVLIILHQWYDLHRKNSYIYFRLYAMFSGLVVLSFFVDAVPTNMLILALLVLPGSAMQSRSNLVYQGLLVGLLVSGLVKNMDLQPWASHVGESVSVAPDNTAALIPPPPAVHEPQINIADSFANITFTWVTPVPEHVDGISMLINDVERGRIYFGAAGADNRLVWIRGPQAVADYFRFAWVRHNKLPRYGDVGVWKVNGEWTGLGGDGK